MYVYMYTCVCVRIILNNCNVVAGMLLGTGAEVLSDPTVYIHKPVIQFRTTPSRLITSMLARIAESLQVCASQTHFLSLSLFSLHSLSLSFSTL